MMMMMIMIAGFMDSITSPIKTWLNTVQTTHDHHNTTSCMAVKELGVGVSPVDCIVCLSEVVCGERLAVLERCKHGFHVKCVEAWLKDHPNCPLCRTPISGSKEDTHNYKHSVYLKKLYEIMSCYGSLCIEIMADWLARVSSTPVSLRAAVSCDIRPR